MRILHATDNYPPSIGGLERSVQTLSRLQVGRGDSVTVVTAQRHDAPASEVDEAGVEVVRLPFTLERVPRVFQDSTNHVFLPPVPDPVFMWHFSRVMRRYAPDIVHTHGWIHYSVCSIASRAGAAVLVTAHDYSFACACQTMYRHGEICSGPSLGKCVRCATEHYGPKGAAIAVGLRASGRLGGRVDGWTGLSEAVASAGTASRAADRAQMVVVPSYVPDGLGEVAGLEERPSYAPAGPYIMFTGALSEHKGVKLLLQAHRRLWDGGLQIPLVLVGVPTESIDGADLSAPGVSVARSVPHREVMRGWFHAALGVAPSLWPEPFGQVAVECLSVGTPLIVSRVGGLTDIVEDEVSGLTVAAGDEDGLVRAMERVLHDPDLGRRLGAAGRVRAERFTVSAVLPEIDRAYTRAMTARRGRWNA
jgi:glycogen(starch) synthase